MNKFDIIFVINSILELVRIIIWPIITFIIVMQLKTPVFELIKRIKKVKYSDIEVELDKINDSISKLPIKNLNSENSGISECLKVAETSPALGIVQAWILLEKSIKEEYKKYYSDYNGSVVRMVQKLANDDKISDSAFEAVKRLSCLRNQVVHGSEMTITYKEAVSHIKYIEQLIIYFNL